MKNRTLLFGEGLFETFRVYRGRVLAFVDDHLDRMAEGSNFFGIPFSRKRAVEALQLGLEKISPDSEARLRLNLISHGDHGVDKTTLETLWEPLQEMSTWETHGVKLGLAPFRRFSGSPVVRFKTTSYIENIFVFRWAREHGLYDALFTNERGEITEGSITNIFFLQKGKILTPPTSAGLLPGVTRKRIMEVARASGMDVEEQALTPVDLGRFDGAFVTNSVIEILPVCRMGDIDYAISERIKTLREGYRKLLKAAIVKLVGEGKH